MCVVLRLLKRIIVCFVFDYVVKVQCTNLLWTREPTFDNRTTSFGHNVISVNMIDCCRACAVTGSCYSFIFIADQYFSCQLLNRKLTLTDDLIISHNAIYYVFVPTFIESSVPATTTTSPTMTLTTTSPTMTSTTTSPTMTSTTNTPTMTSTTTPQPPTTTTSTTTSPTSTSTTNTPTMTSITNTPTTTSTANTPTTTSTTTTTTSTPTTTSTATTPKTKSTTSTSTPTTTLPATTPTMTSTTSTNTPTTTSTATTPTMTSTTSTSTSTTTSTTSTSTPTMTSTATTPTTTSTSTPTMTSTTSTSTPTTTSISTPTTTSTSTPTTTSSSTPTTTSTASTSTTLAVSSLVIITCPVDDAEYTTVTLGNNKIFTYKVMKTRLNQQEARSECALDNSYLARVTTVAKMNFLLQLLRSCPRYNIPNEDYYVDGSNIYATNYTADDAWRMVNGEPVPMSKDFWSDTAPLSPQLQHCLRMRYARLYKLDDISCANAFYFICEK